MVYLYKEALGIELTVPFPRMTYQEAMERYGSDKAGYSFWFGTA